MTFDHLQSAHQARPFRPFSIHTASGESYPVRYPETIASSPDVGVVVVMPGPGQVAMIDLANVAEITFDFNFNSNVGNA